MAAEVVDATQGDCRGFSDVPCNLMARENNRRSIMGKSVKCFKDTVQQILERKFDFFRHRRLSLCIMKRIQRCLDYKLISLAVLE